MVPDTLSWCLPIAPSCSTPYPAALPSATLDTILLEEPFLVRFSAAQFDPYNSEMCKFTQLARSANPHFHIILQFSVALLARQIHLDASLQLTIP